MLAIFGVSLDRHNVQLQAEKNWNRKEHSIMIL